jgi:hypothetical protein
VNVYTYTEARRELASLLDQASEEGAVPEFPRSALEQQAAPLAPAPHAM